MREAKQVRCVVNAVARLRQIATMRTVRDERNRVMYEGAPTPGEVQDELERVYKLGIAAGRRSSKEGR